MPRTSAAELGMIPVVPGGHRLRPPADLGAKEAELFRYLVASLPVSHFVEADTPLLVLYCEAVCMARRCAAGLSKKPELIPIPSSLTQICACVPARSRRTSMRPCGGVNLTAFESRFQITCCSRLGSPGSTTTADRSRPVDPRTCA